MKQLSHRLAARSDLIDIWRYSTGRWGVGQADSYLTLLDDAATRLAAGSLRGKEATGGYRKHRVGSHVIYYREDDAELVVVRVLHQRMQPERHLPG